MHISSSQENYLKAIFKLEETTGIATNQALSSTLESTPAAVTGMLHKLLESGWIEYEAYQGARLTSKGREKAVSTVRKHRLWEVFLVEKLHFEWDAVHTLAEELEHIGDDEFINRLDAFLGNPAFDPHGDPIPDENGKIQKREHTLAAHLAPVEAEFIVCGVNDSSAEFLRHLDQLKIELGKRYTVAQRFEFDGSFLWLAQSEQQTQVSNAVASKILIQMKT